MHEVSIAAPPDAVNALDKKFSVQYLLPMSQLAADIMVDGCERFY